jgi:hypothetical protein
MWLKFLFIKMIANKPFNMQELWNWLLRILMCVISFIAIQTYNDIKQIGKDLSDVKIMIVQGQKDIDYMKDDQKTFKEETKQKLTFLEQKK